MVTKDIEDLWKLAGDSPIGIRIETDAPQQLLNELIESRLELKRAELFEFELRIIGGKVWITRGRQVRTDGEFQPFGVKDE